MIPEPSLNLLFLRCCRQWEWSLDPPLLVCLVYRLNFLLRQLPLSWSLPLNTFQGSPLRAMSLHFQLPHSVVHFASKFLDNVFFECMAALPATLRLQQTLNRLSEMQNDPLQSLLQTPKLGHHESDREVSSMRILQGLDSLLETVGTAQLVSETKGIARWQESLAS